jgi:signal transduction histidine kinase
VVAWLLVGAREVALDRGQRAAAAFVSLAEREVSRTFQATFLTLGAVGDAYQLKPRPPKNDPDFREMMQRRLKDVPFLRALFIIGPEGWILHDTDYPKTPVVSLADRPYFRAHASDPTLGVAAWPPLQSRSSTGWFLPLSRRLGRQAEFEGVVVAALQAAHFSEQFRRVGLPEGYVISLFNTDGTLVATYPPVGEVGRSYAQLPEFARARHKPADTFWADQGLVGGERLVSYRVVDAAPFVVRVSRGRNDVLEQWRHTALGAVVAMTALTLALAALSRRLIADARREARARERRVQAEKLQALGQLSGGMAHDFANQLNVVRVNIALLRKRSQDDEVVTKALDTMERAVTSGRQVTERLLSFARRRPVTMAPVRLDEWVEAARPLMAQVLGAHIALHVELERGVPPTVCDANELDVVLVNLLTNARDAMQGAGRVIVRVWARDPGEPRGHVVALSVKDDGPGMTEEVRRRALEPFFSTKGEAGTGLGLYQVRDFMQQVGGQMTIVSSVGQGTEVRLFFPVATPAA